MLITLSDINYAVRRLLKGPSFTLLTVIVLSGGLGISLYAFAALDMMIRGDLPLPEGDTIVRVGAGSWSDFNPLRTFELAALRNDAESIEEIGVFRQSRALVSAPESARSVGAIESDWRIFEFTRTPPALGRGFVAEDSATGSEPVAVLSHRIWRSLFSSDPEVIGELLNVQGQPTRIIGVMPEGYGFPRSTEMWLPLGQESLDPPTYTGEFLEAYARLSPRVSIESAETELTGIVARIRQDQIVDIDSDVGAVSVLSFHAAFFGPFGAVVFGVLNLLSLSILLLAAVNVGNLLLARTNERIVEIGVRIALGAPRLRLIIQVMLENLILCAIGGVIAIFLVGHGLESSGAFLASVLGEDLPFWWTWSLDRGVVAIAGVFLSLTVLVVSVLPSLSVSRADPNALLRDGTGAGGGLSMGRISLSLVTIQIGLVSTVMIVGGVVVMIAQRAADYDLGFDPTDLLGMNLYLPAETYRTDEQRLRLYEEMLAELRSAASIDAAVIMRQLGPTAFGLDGVDYAVPEARPRAWLNVLSETPTPIGPTLLAGRSFDSRDSATGPRTAIVSETLARTQWPNESALGQIIHVGGSDPERRVVVGIVNDSEFDPLGMSPLGQASIHVPLPQIDLARPRFVVRHSRNEDRARAQIYATIARVDPGLPTYQINSLENVREQATLLARTMTNLFTASGVFAILLAVTGIYGMSRNAVVLRSHEIGLRRALGASNGSVLATFVARGARQLAIGLGLSVLLSIIVLVVIGRYFSLGSGMLALIGMSALLIVSICVLLSTYLSVSGVLRKEPSAVLRHA